ncbi:hypothetical protein [Ammoniphilus resinae]|uniref:Rubredoxin-like domain-containing protein n=1 Tax=Ammoniphilus resinae TaxID=861532 RepID=A0ABS4GNH6_9BACL|nr:hypothetical protein [Ammoniphilus resinae]MBP1931830.1 hypothetical protein [Ammoniphilus resinae]
MIRIDEIQNGKADGAKMALWYIFCNNCIEDEQDDGAVERSEPPNQCLVCGSTDLLVYEQIHYFEMFKRKH